MSRSAVDPAGDTTVKLGAVVAYAAARVVERLAGAKAATREPGAFAFTAPRFTVVPTAGSATLLDIELSLSDNWPSALAKALEGHYPGTMQQDYFDEIFTGHVEIAHMLKVGPSSLF